MADKRETYESPMVTEYGELDKVTKGFIGFQPEDVPLGLPIPLGDQDPVQGS